MAEIALYAWPTPNAFKVSILLEELGLPYRIIPVNIETGEQFRPDFLKINPNNKIPAVVDPDGPDGQPIILFESGAILLYLAEKTNVFIPEKARERAVTIQWLMWQMSGFGPVLYQYQQFLKHGGVSENVLGWHQKESLRLCKVLEKRLQEAPYVSGEPYTIADMALYPWVTALPSLGISLDNYPATTIWCRQIQQRPAVQRGLAVFEEAFMAYLEKTSS
ncbi:MAG: glutathione S-transferase family protein [Alphaproteobacteria bacterium]